MKTSGRAIPLHFAQGRRPESLLRQKYVECSPRRRMNRWPPNGRPRLMSSNKEDGSFCFRVDHRKLNDVTFLDLYLILAWTSASNAWESLTVLATLHANLGYWKIGIDERSCDKTTFTSQNGLYRFTGIPLELNNALQPFREQWM